MSKKAACIALIAGLCTAAEAQVISRLVYEVSLNGTDWRAQAEATPGSLVEVRARVQYIGTQPVVGLAEIRFQPVISSWDGTAAYGNPTGDNLVVRGDGDIPDNIEPIGGTRTTPIGTVPDIPGAYGRISPFGSIATTTTAYYRGFVGTGANSGLMRISQAYVTNWIGSGATSGTNTLNNVSGRAGVTVGQINESLRNTFDPPYNAQLDVAVFKFAYVVGQSTQLRTMNISTPPEGLGHQLIAGLVGPVESFWYTSAAGAYIRGDIEVVGASVNVVPSVGIGSLLASGLLAFGVRRRRA